MFVLIYKDSDRNNLFVFFFVNSNAFSSDEEECNISIHFFDILVSKQDSCVYMSIFREFIAVIRHTPFFDRSFEHRLHCFWVCSSLLWSGKKISNFVLKNTSCTCLKEICLNQLLLILSLIKICFSLR